MNVDVGELWSLHEFYKDEPKVAYGIALAIALITAGDGTEDS